VAVERRGRKIVYGPVPSRRLGRSLGIDLVPYKTCSFDCIYCQLGPTPKTLIRRRAYTSPEEVVSAVKSRLDKGTHADFLTLSGSGEPTLELNLGEILRALRRKFSQRIAVLTNSSLLHMKAVREALSLAHVVLPSLDGWKEEIFQKVNRPHPSVNLEKVVWGLKKLREEFRGEIWLEVLLVEGINDDLQDIPLLLAVLKDIAPDRIQLNTVTRPPSLPWVRPPKRERLEEFAAALGPKAEIVASFKGGSGKIMSSELERSVVETVSRRPLCAEDVASMLGIEISMAGSLLVRLAREKGWMAVRVGEKTYYRPRGESA